MITKSLVSKIIFAGAFALTLGIDMARAGTAEVSFQTPKDGAVVSSPVKVKMKVIGMKVRPANEDVNDKTSGHFHIIIDGKAAEPTTVIPADAKHLHFGKGQTETEVKLDPGIDHTLTLQFADGAHRAYDLSQTIHVHVNP